MISHHNKLDKKWERAAASESKAAPRATQKSHNEEREFLPPGTAKREVLQQTKEGSVDGKLVCPSTFHALQYPALEQIHYCALLVILYNKAARNVQLNLAVACSVVVVVTWLLQLRTPTRQMTDETEASTKDKDCHTRQLSRTNR